MGVIAREISVRDADLIVDELIAKGPGAFDLPVRWLLHLPPTPAGWDAALARQAATGWDADGPGEGAGIQRKQRLAPKISAMMESASVDP